MSDKSRGKQAVGGKNPPPVETRWKKGQSGNPKGMPPRTETQKQLAKVIKDYLNEEDKKKKTNLRKLIEKLAKIRTEKGAAVLLDRAYGKVPQPLTGEIEGDVVVRVVYDKRDHVNAAGATSEAK